MSVLKFVPNSQAMIFYTQALLQLVHICLDRLQYHLRKCLIKCVFNYS